MNVSVGLIFVRPDLCWFKHLTQYAAFCEDVRKVGRWGVACSIGPPGTIFPAVMTTKAKEGNLDSVLRLLKGGDEKMDEPMFLVLAIRHSVTEWRCDQSRRVPSVPRALGPPLCFSVAVLNQSSSSMSCLLTRKGVGSKLRIGSLDLKMRGAARPSRSNSHDEPYISTGKSPALGPFPRDCSD